jgi:DNA processing protein
MNDDKRFQLALSLTPGVGNVNTKNLISYCGSATAVFSSKTANLYKIPGIGVKTIASIKNGSIIHEADKILEYCEKNQIQIYHYTDENYPVRLKTIADAPSIIYASGKGNFNTKKILAIVGTRNATEYGLEITRKIIADLAGSDVLIISGLAYGVDIEAHKACLEMGVSTYGIMANGHHKIYPSQHKKIASKMCDTGG